MDNFVNYGKTYSYVPATQVLKNQIVNLTGLIGISNNSVTTADIADVTLPDAKKIIVLQLEGRFEVDFLNDYPYTASAAIGDVLYYDSASGKATEDNSGGIKLGTAATASDSNDKIEVYLNKFFY